MASEEGRRSVVLSLVAAVATTYIDLRSLDGSLKSQSARQRPARQAMSFLQLRFQGGIISDLELAQVQSQYEESLAEIPSIEKNIAFTEHGLSLLLGR